MDSGTQNPGNQISVPAPGSYAPVGASIAVQPATPRRGANRVLIVGAGILLVLLAGIIAAATLGFFVLDKVISQIPTAQIGQLKTESQAVPAGSAQIIHANVTMGAGTLVVDGDASGTNAFNGTFTYNVSDWQPRVSYNDGTGNLTINQSHSDSIVKGSSTGATNNWDLHLNKSVPVALNATMGAGDSTLKLDGLELRGLYVSTGAANLTIDLSHSRWAQGVLGTIQGGVGNTVIMLPTDTGARVSAHGGLGNVEAGGFTRSGSIYTNSAYGKSASTIDLTVQVGVGNITLQQK